MTSHTDLLMHAKSLVESGWTQRYAAVSAENYQVDPNDEEACRWCLEGSLMNSFSRASASGGDLDLLLDVYYDARRALMKIIGSQDLVEWNDAKERTQEDVILAFELTLLHEGVK